MNARRVRAAEGVVFAAMKTRQTAAGIAAALEAACLLQSPETAAEQLALLAEVDRLRLRVDEVERAYTFDTAALEQRVAELEGVLSRLGSLAEQRHLVDPLDHVLEHLADERTTVVLPGQRDRRWQA
jgi:hypothetical protein